MARDRTFVYEADQQNLSGDAIIELFLVDLTSAVAKLPDGTDGIEWENSAAKCDPIPISGGGWELGDMVNNSDISICTAEPNYNDPAFDPGAGEYDDADIEPRSEIEKALFSSEFFTFCNWQETDGASVKFGGVAYVPIPYQQSGFAISNEGVLPNPQLTMSNVGLEPTALVNGFDDLLGARVIRRRVLAKHLDNGSDPNVNDRWPDETWFVQRKVTENKMFVTFELSTPFDLDGVTIPKRRALRKSCLNSSRDTTTSLSSFPGLGLI